MWLNMYCTFNTYWSRSFLCLTKATEQITCNKFWEAIANDSKDILLFLYLTTKTQSCASAVLWQNLFVRPWLPMSMGTTFWRKNSKYTAAVHWLKIDILHSKWLTLNFWQWIYLYWKQQTFLVSFCTIHHILVMAAPVMELKLFSRQPLQDQFKPLCKAHKSQKRNQTASSTQHVEAPVWARGRVTQNPNKLATYR